MTARRAYAGTILYSLLIPGMLVIAFPSILVETHHRPFRIGAIVAAQNWGMVFAPLWGWVADRWRRWNAALTASAALSAIALFGISHERPLSGLLLSSFLLGIGGGGLATVSVAALARPDGAAATRGLTGRFARVQTLGSIGTLAGLVLGGIAPPRRGVMAGAAAACVLALAAGRFRPGGDAAPASAPSAVPAEHPLPRTGPTGSLGAAALLLLCWLVFSVSVSQFMSQYPIAMAALFRSPVRASALALAVGTVAGLPAYAVSARAIAAYGAIPVFIAGLALRAACLVGLAVAAHAGRAGDAAALPLAACFQAAWPPIGLASARLAVFVSFRSPGFALGLLAGLGALATGVGSVTDGLLAECCGYRTALLSAALLALLACLSAALLQRRVSRDRT